MNVQLSDDFVTQAREELKSIIKESLPSIDLRKGGAMNDLLLNGVALGLALINQRISEFEATQSLKSLEDAGTDLTTIDPSVIEAILSNWFITRKPGGFSRGLVQVTVSASKLYFIPKNFEFTTGDGVVFITEQSYTIQPDDSSFVPGNVKLRTLDSVAGTFFALIPVVAASAGLNDIAAETALATTTNFDAAYLSSHAFANFDGGSVQETTTELLARSKDAVTLRNNQSRKAIRTTMKESFPTIRDISVIGYGDREQLRDITRGLRVHVGGKVDIYARTSSYPTIQVVDRTFDSNGSLVLAAFNDVPDPFPIYKVLGVYLASDAAKFANYSNFELDPADFIVTREPADEFFDVGNIPDVSLAPLATRYTLLEKITIQAVDVATYADQDVSIILQGMFDLADIHKVIVSDEERQINSDQLIKAPVPCYVNFTMKYSRDRNATIIDTVALTSALQDHINSIPIGSSLDVSQLICIAQDYGATRVQLPLVVNGTVQAPDLSEIVLQSSDSLVIPTKYSIGLSPRTTAFFCGQNDIVLQEVIG